MTIAEHAVIAGYRMVLGRDPESQQTIIDQAQDNETLEQFYASLISSQEFQRKTVLRGVGMLYNSPPQQIEVDVAPAVLEKLIERTQRGWERLGATEPYWSVVTFDKFRGGDLSPEVKREFYEMGPKSADLVELFEARAGTRVARGTCLELGCGVGRVTAFLAQKFERVIAVDISPGNLKLCEEYLIAQGIRNVECILVERLQDYERVEAFDFLYSLMVLMHNSPPVQRYILDCLTRKIARGGAALIQATASLPGYSFGAASYLASPEPAREMEMHALPMVHVLRILQRNGLEVLEVAMDTWTYDPGSYTYFAAKG